MRALRWVVALPFKLIGWAALALAVVTLARDVFLFVTVDEAAFRLTPLGALWFEYARGSLNLVQAGVQRGLHPWLWDPVMASLLRLPAPIALGLVGVLALLFGRLIYR